MARTALIVKCNRKKRQRTNAISAGRKPVKGTRVYNRCRVCGRNRGYMRDFDLCRICFREYARQGKVMGVRKSSW